MNEAYQKYMDDKRDEESKLVGKITELAERLKTDFNISTAMRNPDASYLHTPPCEWYTEVQDQTPDQLDSLCNYLEELGDLIRRTRDLASQLASIRDDIKEAKPEDFED